MYKILYLPDPTAIGFNYESLFLKEKEARNFLNYWEGSRAYLFEVIEVPDV